MIYFKIVKILYIIKYLVKAKLYQQPKLYQQQYKSKHNKSSILSHILHTILTFLHMILTFLRIDFLQFAVMLPAAAKPINTGKICKNECESVGFHSESLVL